MRISVANSDFALRLALLFCSGLCVHAAWGQGNVFPSSGNVGIGTTTPQSSLDISSAGQLHLRLNTAATSYTDLLRNGSIHWQYGLDDHFGSAGFFIYDDTSANYRFGINAVTGNMLLQPAGGNVGIGTASPQHLLHVAGTIGAEEVIVSQSGADYVFDPNYHLAPLSEVASYIEEHHHLPDIPSAEDMQNNGASVGEMQRKLLAKVEELTLHMIQEHERNSRLEHENQELRDRLEQQTREVQQRLARLERQ